MTYTPGYFPGHIYRVKVGPFAGKEGMWHGVFADNVIGLIFADENGLPIQTLSPAAITFRIEDLEDITPKEEGVG